MWYRILCFYRLRVIPLMPSPPSICLSIRLYPLYLLNRLTLVFCVSLGRDLGWPGIEGQGRGLGSLGQSNVDQGQFVF